MKALMGLGIFSIAGIIMGCQPADPVQQATTRLKPVVDAYVFAWNSGNVDTLDSMVDQQVIRYDGIKDPLRTLDSLKQYVTRLRTMYPDFKVTVEEEIYIGERAMVRWTVSGTNTGPGAFPPTGKPFRNSGLSVCRIANGKLLEERVETDQLVFMEQLGFKLIPPGK